MDANFILDAIRNKYPTAAIVPEITITDPYVKNQIPGERVYGRRIDALMFSSLQRTAIEIKVSKQDMAREHWNKWDPWRRVTHRFIYVVPAGLGEFHDFRGDTVLSGPHMDAGLWWVHEDGKIEVRRKAKINKYPDFLPQDVVQRLAYRAAGNSYEMDC